MVSARRDARDIRTGGRCIPESQPAAGGGPRRPGAQLLEANMKAILSTALVLGFCSLAGAQGDKPAPIGTWKCEYKIGDQKRTAEITITKDGDKLAGTINW